MSFWENLIRYPIFFFSSMVGLFSVLLGPVMNLIKQLPNKGLAIFLVSIIVSCFFLTLKQMLNLD